MLSTSGPTATSFFPSTDGNWSLEKNTIQYTLPENLNFWPRGLFVVNSGESIGLTKVEFQGDTKIIQTPAVLPRSDSLVAKTQGSSCIFLYGYEFLLTQEESHLIIADEELSVYAEFRNHVTDEAKKYLSTNKSVFNFIIRSLPKIKKIAGDVPIGLEYLSDSDEDWGKLYLSISLNSDDDEVITNIENELYFDWLFTGPDEVIQDIVISFS